MMQGGNIQNKKIYEYTTGEISGDPEDVIEYKYIDTVRRLTNKNCFCISSDLFIHNRFDFVIFCNNCFLYSNKFKNPQPGKYSSSNYRYFVNYMNTIYYLSFLHSCYRQYSGQ